jgi:uncharacterized protein
MSPPSEDSSPFQSHRNIQPEYTPEERAWLLKLARDAIGSELEDRIMLAFEPTPHLSEPRGVFTTVYLGNRLKGCVGYPLALMPLYRAVMETARGAAFDDPRFAPLTLAEAPQLTISLSVLSPLSPFAAEDVEPGRHGLLISHGDRRGLLLPQVPTEHGWDRITFLEQTCRKAGLPLDAWRQGAKIEAFTAEVFGDIAAS